MNLSKSKKIKLSALAGILSVGILTTGYSKMNKEVVLVVDGKKQILSTFKTNVGELLEEEKVKYDENDIVNLKLDTKLSNGIKVEVIDVEEKTIKESKEVPFEVDIVEDSDLDKGKTSVQNEGRMGKNELVYKVIYHNGKKVEKKFVEELVSIKPSNKIVKKGTKEEVQVASSRGENTRTITTASVKSTPRTDKTISVVATAYTGHSVTSTGTIPKWGTIAVDPSVIPYGSKVYIPSLNKTFIAEDCGGAIKGNKIDIYMGDESSVNSWGRQTIEIQILG
ncbi:DUF348 domain-containing protein [Romboutsia maritimum]|uniref:DUF348 domain-containing protein n=1 Tax=Romboutsia maritimum TaxID=2020948 RepID=A0A371IU28_9FIRM|nr:3D domain-containing protein [Romboutsia maritimum]RDY23994.1 DUF348 domain-containing protein [Romboutsia maritimum]